jgi:hypothetical protein
MLGQHHNEVPICLFNNLEMKPPVRPGLANIINNEELRQLAVVNESNVQLVY